MVQYVKRVIQNVSQQGWHIIHLLRPLPLSWRYSEPVFDRCLNHRDEPLLQETFCLLSRHLVRLEARKRSISTTLARHRKTYCSIQYYSPCQNKVHYQFNLWPSSLNSQPQIKTCQKHLFLGGFAKLRKPTISFIVSILLHGTDQVKFSWNFIFKYFSKIKFE